MFKQGEKYINNLQKKITEGLKPTNQEGFNGILGSNPTMDATIARDTAGTLSNTTRANNNIAQYGTDYGTLKQRTNLYLNDSKNNYNTEKNYNIFINQSLKQNEITATNQLGCVDAFNVNNVSLAAGFDQAYPTNFKNYTDAETACKLWAADTGSPVYALHQPDAGTNATAKYNCYVGNNNAAKDLRQYTKPSKLYTVAAGNSSAIKGGLFKNGLIGAYNGEIKIDSTWNINNMYQANLLKKYNSDNYSGGPQPVAQVVNGGWWGFPGQGGWGGNAWPSNTDAWWISTADYMFVGTMGYFYYIYNSTFARDILIYAVVDDAAVLTINGREINRSHGWETGGHVYFAQLRKGKNVIEVKLINTGGPGAFVFYAVDYPNYRNVLFTSGPGWGYSSTAVSNYNSITNSPVDNSNPYGIQAANPIPPAYAKCDAFLGGNINAQTVNATYGKNCSGQPMPAAASCPTWDCTIEGQKCLRGSPGASNVSWICKSNKWEYAPDENVKYQIQNINAQYCLSDLGGNGQYATGREVLTSTPCQSSPTAITGWDFKKTNQADIYMIHNTEKNVCLFNNADGRLGVSPCNPDWNDQTWKLVHKPNAFQFQLKNVNSNKCLYNNRDGRFDVYTCGPWDDQQWTVLNGN